MKYILILILIVLVSLGFYYFSNSKKVENALPEIKQNIIENNKVPNTPTSEEINSNLTAENFLQKLVSCEPGKYTISDTLPHPIFGKFDLTVDIELIKGDLGVCHQISTNYRNIIVLGPDGKKDEDVSGDLEEAYKTMTATCSVGVEDRENMLKQFKEQQKTGKFGSILGSGYGSKCKIEGLN